MTMEILTYPNPELAKKSVEVDEITPELKQLAKDMAATMYASKGIGLAAPQVGKLIRFVVVDVEDEETQGDPLFLVNPRITHAEGSTEFEEGCLSVPEFRSKVSRKETVTVEALDLDGNPLTLEAEGLLAICLQHEIDHLDGVLFIDKVSRLKRTFYDKKVKKWLRRGKGE